MYFGHGDLADVNWKPRVDSYIKTLNIWQQRHLSMKGKTIIINQLAASKLIYTAHTYPCKCSVRQYKLTKANIFYKLFVIIPGRSFGVAKVPASTTKLSLYQ